MKQTQLKKDWERFVEINFEQVIKAHKNIYFLEKVLKIFGAGYIRDLLQADHQALREKVQELPYKAEDGGLQLINKGEILALLKGEEQL